MPQSLFFRLLRLFLLPVLAVIFLRYGFPLVLPFLAGGGVALAAEPPVRFLCQTFPFKRNFASFLGVTMTLVVLSALGLLLFSAVFHGLRWLASIAPELLDTARRGLTSLQDWLLTLARGAPEGIRDLLTKTVLGIFDSGDALYSQAAAALPGLAAGFFSHLTGGFLGLGTAILSAYLISARLPQLKQWVRSRLPDRWTTRYRPALRNLRLAAGGWLKAQTRLMGLTFFVLLAGFWLLQIRFAPIWAAVIALVDAIPMLGTGMILIPWSIVSFLKQDQARAVGLLGIFAAATLARSALEPRLVGQQLGLDPLVTLISLYLGYQLLGIPGLLAAPLLAMVSVRLLNTPPAES